MKKILTILILCLVANYLKAGGTPPCNGTPTAGVLTAVQDTVCNGSIAELVLTGFSTGTGITFGWEESPDGVTWAPASGAGLDTFYTSPLNGSLFFRCTLTCANSGLTASSNTQWIVVPYVYNIHGDTSCTANNFTLSASGGNGSLHWFNAATGGTEVAAGDTFHTPLLSATTTYYVEDRGPSQIQSVGPLDNTIGAGGNYNVNADRFEIFNAYQPFTILTVKVFAQGTANRTFRLTDSLGNVLHDTIINVPAGTQTVHVNVPVPAASGLRFGVRATANLYRNTAGAAYPYYLPGVCNIIGNSAAAAGYFYFVYDWQLRTQGCASPRVPVTAFIGSGISAPVISPAGPVTVCAGTQVSLTSSGNAPFLWSTGETTQSIQTDTTGSYIVSVFDATCSNWIASAPVSVNVLPVPVASFTYLNIPGTAGMQFTSTSTNTNSWSWDFGDGNSSSAASAVNTYTNNHLPQTVTLISSNGVCSDTTVQNICVPYTALASGGTYHVCSGGSISLSAINGTSWQWNNGASTQQMTVDTSGYYFAMVSEGACGPYNTDTAQLIVLPVPVASFTTTVSGDTASFQNTSTGAGDVQWNFGDGGGSTIFNTMHAYTDGDSVHMVTLIVTNGACSDTISHTVIVHMSDTNTGTGALSATSFRVYPSPAHEVLQIQLNGQSSWSFRLVNLLGVEVNATVQPIAAGTYTMDVKNLPAGIYWLQAGNGTQQFTRKVVKQ